MAEFSLPKNSKVTAGKRVPAPAGAKAVRTFKVYRYDPETEAKYKKDKGPQMEAAFQNVDRLEARQAWVSQRATLSRRMDEFRKLGKLAEYTAVQ